MQLLHFTFVTSLQVCERSSFKFCYNLSVHTVILSYIRTCPGPDGDCHNPKPGDLIIAEGYGITALSGLAFFPMLDTMLGGTPAMSHPATADPAECSASIIPFWDCVRIYSWLPAMTYPRSAATTSHTLAHSAHMTSHVHQLESQSASKWSPAKQTITTELNQSHLIKNKTLTATPNSC